MMAADAQIYRIPRDWTRACVLRGPGISYSALKLAAQRGGVLERKEEKEGKRKAVYYRNKTPGLFE